MAGYIFGGTTGETYQSLQRRRQIADALSAQIMGTTPKTAQEGWGAVLKGIGAGIGKYRADKAIDERTSDANSAYDATLKRLYDGITGGGVAMPSGGSTGSIPTPEAAGQIAATAPGGGGGAAPSGNLPSSFLSAVDSSEGGGRYDTLFGHAQRNGPLAGTDVSQMTVGEALAFSDPKGPYAQQVKSQIGRVATPMGRHQIVGTTLRNATQEMGLDPSTPFDAGTQDAVAAHLARRRIAGSSTMAGKISGLRSEWEGFRNVPDAQMQQIVRDLENGGGAPQQVASLDPSAGMTAPQAIERQAPASGYVDPMVSAPNAQPAPAGPQMAAAPPLAPPQNVSTPPVPPMPAQPPAAPPQQVAQAQSPYAGIDPELLRHLSNPWLDDDKKEIVRMLIKRQQDANDPDKALDRRYKNAQIDSLTSKPDKTWQKLDDTTLFNPASGETKSVGAAPNQSGGFRFEGKSVEAQALNGLMESGQISPDQAQQLGAGKTITGPNGEIIFMTPQGVFGQSPQGGAPRPLGGNQAPADGVDIFGTPPGAPPSPQPPVPAAGPQRNGMIPLTNEKVTADENKAGGFADRMRQAENSIKEVPAASTGMGGVFGNMVSDNDYIPDALESSLMTGDFQQYDQARRNFINAQMRRESGAVIGKDEFSNANKQYFPMPGDTPETLEKKAQNRKTVIDAMRRDAGPTYGRKDGGGETDPLGIR